MVLVRYDGYEKAKVWELNMCFESGGTYELTEELAKKLLDKYQGFTLTEKVMKKNKKELRGD